MKESYNTANKYKLKYRESGENMQLCVCYTQHYKQLNRELENWVTALISLKATHSRKDVKCDRIMKRC